MWRLAVIYGMLVLASCHLRQSLPLSKFTDHCGMCLAAHLCWVQWAEGQW
jgi:hypothetical protein